MSAPGPSTFVFGDYVVFALMLFVSTAVGVYYAWKDRNQRTSRDFLTGGKSFSALPVALSLTASFTSAISILSTPVEVYRFGAVFVLCGVSYVLTTIVTSEIFLPVFYRLGITSTNEYLELRFNRATRLLGTVVFIVQMVLCIGIIVYAPALALAQVTAMDLWVAIVSTGLVCTFYCTVGGLKAVVWTDVFQVAVLFAGLLAVIVRSVIVQGGVIRIIKDSQEGGRLNFWDFDMNPLRRHTFWTIIIGATFVYLNIYGINQAQVQRYVACKSLTHARLSLYINLLGLLCIMFSAVFTGLCLYSIYKGCDPWSSGLISTHEQLMPLLVVDILRGYPGLPGLFVAAAYSGSLSTASSGINALAVTTVEDLIKPYANLSEKQLSRISKGLCFSYGLLCIGVAALSSLVTSMLQAVMSIGGVLGGPLLGVFTLGLLCPFANSKGALSGAFLGFVLCLWVAIGSQVYPPGPELTRPLPLTTKDCNFTNVAVHNWTGPVPPTEASLFTAPVQDLGSGSALDKLYSVSYLYFSLIGTMTAVCVGIIVSFFSGGTEQKTDTKLTLLKEDTMLFLVYNFFKHKVQRQNVQPNLAKDRLSKVQGNANPAFVNTELTLK